MHRFLVILLLLMASPILPTVTKGQLTEKNIRGKFRNMSQTHLCDTLIRSSDYYAEENPDTSLSICKLALAISMRINDQPRIAESYKQIAEAYYYLNNYPSAIENYFKSAEIDYQMHNDSTSYLAERISDAAFCYQELGLYDKALELYFKALSLQIRAKNQTEISSVMLNIGTSYYYKARYDKAIEYFSRTLALDRKSGDSSAIAISLNNLGMVYNRWGKHSRALEFYEEALSYTRLEISKAVRYSNIGMSWFHLGNYRKALDYLKKALHIDEKYNQKIKIGIHKNEIGNVLTAEGELDQALKLHKAALTIFRETGITESQIITLTDIGDIYKKERKWKDAEACYLESLHLSDSIGSLFQLSQNYKALSNLAEDQNDYESALRYYQLYTQTKDSVFNTEKHEQLANFEILYDTEKKEQTNILLKKDLEIKQRKQRLFIATTIGLTVFLLLLINLYQSTRKNLKQSKLLLEKEHELHEMERARREAEKQSLENRIFAEQQINRLEREKYHAEIEFKNSQLTNTTISLVNKNEILGEIRERLKTAQKHDGIHEIIQFINSNTDIDQDWKKFRIHYDEIHPGFFDRLRSAFPDVTDNDIRLSAYLRANLTSREISGLMNVSLDATNKSRQRLRKKLNLAPEADLTEFLLSI